MSESKRYVEPRAYLKARSRLKARDRAVLDELIARYKKAGDEKPVAATDRQIADSVGMGHMTVSRSLKVLEREGFHVAVEKSSYELKHKPSRYRLTMFPCGGKDATHNYIVDPDEWRRQRSRRKQKPVDRPLPAVVMVPVPLDRYVRALEDAEAEAEAHAIEADRERALLQ